MNDYRKIIRTIIKEELSERDDTAGKEKLGKVKVRMFFSKLQKHDALMQYLDFRNPVEQAEAIIKFASLVGVPQSKIPAILASFRQLSTTKPPAKQ